MRTGAICFVVSLGVLAAVGHALAEEDASATGISRLFNPAISVNGLFLVSSDAMTGFAGVDQHEHEDGEHEGHGHGQYEKGFNFQEAEVRFTANVDPFTKADIVFAIPGIEGIEIEEADVALSNLPAGLGARFGKFYAQLGRHNRLHTHQYPFIDAPVVSQVLLGDEGVNELGIEGAYLLPLPWFSDIVASMVQGDNELFASTDDEDFAYLLRSRNLWDLAESTTLDLGFSGMNGKNTYGGDTYVGSIDLTVRWQPLRNAYRQFVWQSEWIGVDREELDHQEEVVAGDVVPALNADEALLRRKPWGAYGLLQYRFLRTWWAQGRFGHFEPPAEGNAELPGVINRWSALLAYVPSEFSAVRLQYNHVRQASQTDHQVLLQFNFTIGSHPAHRY